MEVLDVGRGPNPKGDVNLDLYPGKTGHRDFETEIKSQARAPLVLDVGCGNSPHGDINLDLNFGVTEHRTGGAIDLKITMNPVRGDINNLPFRSKVFSKAYCSKVLEHKGVNFRRSIKELCRVVREEVEIVIPHRYGRNKWYSRAQIRAHDKFFSISTVLKLFQNLGISPDIRRIYRYFPHELFPLVKFPHLLRITFRVRKDSFPKFGEVTIN